MQTVGGRYDSPLRLGLQYRHVVSLKMYVAVISVLEQKPISSAQVRQAHREGVEIDLMASLMFLGLAVWSQCNL